MFKATALFFKQNIYCVKYKILKKSTKKLFMRKKVGVIGAGIGGMATAVLLKQQGFDVTVFEKNEYPGGKIGQVIDGKYRFDLGPSVFTMPELVDELYQAVGETPEDYFQYDSLDQSCRYFYEDGTVLTAYRQTEDFIKELTRKTGEPENHIRAYLDKSRTIYDLTADIFMFRSIHSASDLLNRQTLWSLMNSRKIDAFHTMHQSNEKQFESEKLVQLFDRYATYNGSDPYRTPATFNIISHLEHNKGVYYPVRGIYSIAEGLLKLMKTLSIDVHLNEGVNEIVPGRKRVERLITDSGEYTFDYMVSNMDVNLFYSQVLKDEAMLKKVIKPEKSSSALIFYWGVRGRFPELGLHNILFSQDYPGEFRHLFGHKKLHSDPTVYIYISSKVVPEDAPRGCENWYVMVNAPEDTGQDWTVLRSQVREHILAKIHRMLGIDLRDYIETEQVMDPPAIGRYTSSYHGSLYGNSSNSRFAAFNRHPNFSRKYRNLYFTGGSVHPGGGIPLSLASARIVSDKIRRHEQRQR